LQKTAAAVLGVDAVVFLLAMMQFSMQICSLCLLMSCLVQTFFFFHFLGNCLIRLFFSRLIHNLNTRVMAFMSLPYGMRMPCSCVAYVV